MTSGTISLTIPKLKNMEEGLVSPHWLVTTCITPSFLFSKTNFANIHSESNPKHYAYQIHKGIDFALSKWSDSTSSEGSWLIFWLIMRNPVWMILFEWSCPLPECLSSCPSPECSLIVLQMIDPKSSMDDQSTEVQGWSIKDDQSLVPWMIDPC